MDGEKAKAGLMSPSVPCVGAGVGRAFSAVHHSAALCTKTPLGSRDAVAEHLSGAAALVLASSFAALSPQRGSGAQKYLESTGRTAPQFSVSNQMQQL